MAAQGKEMESINMRDAESSIGLGIGVGIGIGNAILKKVAILIGFVFFVVGILIPFISFTIFIILMVVAMLING